VGEEVVVKKKFLIYGGIAIALYLVYQNTVANPSSNSSGGGVDFGVLDPNNW
jgi:hypothetical protein